MYQLLDQHNWQSNTTINCHAQSSCDMNWAFRPMSHSVDT